MTKLEGRVAFITGTFSVYFWYETTVKCVQIHEEDPIPWGCTGHDGGSLETFLLYEKHRGSVVSWNSCNFYCVDGILRVHLDHTGRDAFTLNESMLFVAP